MNQFYWLSQQMQTHFVVFKLLGYSNLYWVLPESGVPWSDILISLVVFTVKSGTVDWTTIEFSTFLGVLLTEMCHRPKCATVCKFTVILLIILVFSNNRRPLIQKFRVPVAFQFDKFMTSMGVKYKRWEAPSKATHDNTTYLVQKASLTMEQLC